MSKKYNSLSELGKTEVEQLEVLRKLVEKENSIKIVDTPFLSFSESNEKINLLEQIDLLLKWESYKSSKRHRRQKDSINFAKQRGVRFGRKVKPLPNNFEEVYKAYCEGKISQREAGKQLGVSNHTFAKWKKLKEQ